MTGFGRGADMTTYYWHILPNDGRLGYGDGRQPSVGKTLTVDGDIAVCDNGLHACERLIDCLQYATGSIICKVALGDVIVVDGDKVASNARTIVAMTSAEEGKRILREFARWCALSVAHLWDTPEVVRRYLESGDESLRDAARDAALAAARAAARAAALAAARAAARDAARAAALAAARDAARAAARDAALAAARAAAGDAARAAQNEKLVEMVEGVLT